MKKALCLILCCCFLIACLPFYASAASVILSPQNLTVNGQPVSCEKYNIDGSNYFKLRDIAFLLNGTPNQFEVGYNAETKTVTVTSGLPYTPNGEELVIGMDRSSTAVPSSQSIVINGVVNTSLSAYNLAGNNFFKLRDLGDALGFSVDYDGETNTAIIQTATQSPAVDNPFEGTFVFDAVGILGEEDFTLLNDFAKEVSSQYSCGVYIAVFDNKAELEAENIEMVAEGAFLGLNLGIGSDKCGILLALSITDREYDICAHGELANRIFTDSAKNAIADTFMDSFKNDAWANGFFYYITVCKELLQNDGAVHVFDVTEPKLLSVDEWAMLDASAAVLCNNYKCDVVIATFNDMRDYGYSDIESFSEAVYREWDLGVGDDRCCIVLVLSMAERDYDILYHGAVAQQVYQLAGNNGLAESFLSFLAKDEWFEGFGSFLSKCGDLLIEVSK